MHKLSKINVVLKFSNLLYLHYLYSLTLFSLKLQIKMSIIENIDIKMLHVIQ